MLDAEADIFGVNVKKVALVEQVIKQDTGTPSFRAEGAGLHMALRERPVSQGNKKQRKCAQTILMVVMQCKGIASHIVTSLTAHYNCRTRQLHHFA